VVVVVVFGFPTLRDSAGSSSSLSECTESARTIAMPFGAESSAGRWQPVKPFPIAHDELRADAIGETVYVGTGIRQAGSELVSTDVFYAFDATRGAYRELPPPPRRVDHPAFVAAGGDLYVIGGYHDWLTPTDETLRFSPETGAWTELAPMSVPRGSPAAAAIDGKIFVAGGAVGREESDRQPTGDLEIYDIRTGRWSTGTSMPTPRHHAGAAAIGGVLYVLGGRSESDLSLDVVERYDTRTQTWEEAPHLPQGVGGLGAVVADERLVAISGGDDDEGWVTPGTWAFDPAADRWQRLADLRVPRHGHGAAAVGDDIYVFGGAPCPGYGRTDSVEKLSLGD
jgi:N-acetylneuraminic acid mutarotase